MTKLMMLLKQNQPTKERWPTDPYSVWHWFWKCQRKVKNTDNYIKKAISQQKIIEMLLKLSDCFNKIWVFNEKYVNKYKTELQTWNC